MIPSRSGETVLLDIPGSAGKTASLLSYMFEPSSRRGLAKRPIVSLILDGLDALDVSIWWHRWPVFHLGLRLDKGRREISREGFPPVTLTRRLLWDILEILMKNGTKFTDRESILNAWQGTYPERSTIEDAIRDLRKAVKPLKVGIANAKGTGWRLVN